MPAADFRTAREKLIAVLENKPGAFDASTLPVESVASLRFEVVDPRPVGAPTMAHAVARRGSRIRFFDYKVGDTIPDGFGGTRAATEYDTTLTDPRKCPGGRAMAVESLSLRSTGVRIRYLTAQFPEGEAPTDPSVVRAYGGGAILADPAGLAAPPQLESPANLEHLFCERVLPLLQFTVGWNQQNYKLLGYLDQVPEGAGNSALRSHGDARVDNRFVVPEGWFWGGECVDTGDRELTVTAELTSDLVIPITLIRGLVGTDPVTQPVPQGIAVDFRMRLHGMQIGAAGRN